VITIVYTTKISVAIARCGGKHYNQIIPAEKIGSPSKGMAEGGRGGNSAIPLQKIEASSATLLFKARRHRKILFSLREKEIRRAKNEKSKEYFSVVWRAERAVAGLASLVSFKVGSSKVQNIPSNYKNPASAGFLWVCNSIFNFYCAQITNVKSFSPWPRSRA